MGGPLERRKHFMRDAGAVWAKLSDSPAAAVG